ncbi:hypothetical protein [Mycolicibacterium vinylchloridicum]|uniref:hypothetical protein n=1 Tax=Mycolicibacterium vinylchloridicum TaxID=2736928 RepID=UPI0015C8FC75|nr:hypothetical protein [Mycolicibacterium vinylchloridicum]
MGGILSVRSDPMSARVALVVAATGPAACVLTCLSIPGLLGNPNQANAFGASVAIFAFLCVRGRTGTAWWAFVATSAIMTGWSLLTGQGLYGLKLAAPNVAVLGMATLFAFVVRPAATEIRELRKASIDQAQKLAAAQARMAERDRQRTELRDVAWPTLLTIARGERLTAAQVAEIRLSEARLRDSVRARALNVPSVVDAARGARSRGLNVVMFDDGGMDAIDASVRLKFCHLATEWLGRIENGSITVRIHPPGRDVAGSIVVTGNDGMFEGVEIGKDGTIHES